MELIGKTALLTGATGGLGRAIAEAVSERGATLVLSARSREALEELAGELRGEHRIAPADLGEEGAAERLIAEAGRIDCLIANAGIGAAPGRLERFSPEGIGNSLRVNLEAPIRMAHGLLPGMLERGEGHLAFISSLNAKAGTPRSSVYTGTKAGLRSFALALRSDLAAKNVGVSVVSPGLIREAGMFAKSGASAPAILGTGTPEQVGAAVVRAIERNRAEVAVAPLRQRALSHFALTAPRIAGWALAGGPLKGKATSVADRVTEAEAKNR